MAPDDFVSLLGREQASAILRTSVEEAARPAMEAAVRGGFRIVEFTLNTPGALDRIEEFSRRDDLIVGAGTVTTSAAAAAAIDAGARFIVSPGLDDGVIATAHERGVPAIPGIATPTELMRALASGANVVKLFPAEVVGGVDMVAALSAVWPDIRFMPTGGISAANAPRYLAMDRVVAVGGTWMVSRPAVAAGDWGAVTAAAAEAAALGKVST